MEYKGIHRHNPEPVVDDDPPLLSDDSVRGYEGYSVPDETYTVDVPRTDVGSTEFHELVGYVLDHLPKAWTWMS
jgi:hypothetical protein